MVLIFEIGAYIKFLYTTMLCILLLFSSLQLRAEVLSEVMNYEEAEILAQAREKQWVGSLTPTLSQMIFVANSFTETISSKTIGYGLEYGFSKELSLSLSDDFGSASTQISSFESTATGVSNIALQLKSQFELKNQRKFFASFLLSISPGNASSTKRYYGGNIYTPQIAWQRRLDETSLLVFKFDSTYYGPITFDPGVSTSGSFSSSVSSIYEMKMNENKFGGQVGFTHYYTGGDFTNYILLAYYASFATSKSLSLMPYFSYTVPIDALTKKAGVKEDDLFSLLLNARYAF